MNNETYLISNNIPTIKQLQCFLVVANELNFRKAAERLRMTQPPLTRQIKCLEDVLGQQLFNRNTHDVSLTEVGITLLMKAQQIVEGVHDLKRQISKNENILRIGLTHTLNFDSIESVSKQLNQIGVEDDVNTPYLTSIQLLQCLEKSALDLVLTGEKAGNQSDTIRYNWIYREPLVLALPSKHPASIKDKVSLNDVIDLPLFWFSRSSNPAFYDKCEKVFSKLNAPIRRIREPDDSLAMLSHIARGKGFALMPQSKSTFHQQGLCYRELIDSEAKYISIDVYAAIRSDESREFVLNAQRLLGSAITNPHCDSVVA